MTPSRSPMRVLMLVTDAHSGFGGIAQYNQDVLEALSASDRIQEVVVLPRVIHQADFCPPPKIVYDLQTSKGTLSFSRRCLWYALFGGHFDLIYCAHINLMPVATRLAWWRSRPLVLAIYGIDAWNPPVRRLGGFAARSADLVMSISHVTLRRFQAWASVDKARTAVVPNAIRTDRFGAGPKDKGLLQRYGLEDRTVIMTLGRMSADERYKGFDEIIELLPKLLAKRPDIAYLVVGDGSDRSRLEAKASNLRISEHVVFAGRIAESEKVAHYRLADAYVMPSSGEGFGFVVLEALACGIPVVVSTADGTHDAVRGGELGYLIDPKDSTALEEAILQAINQPKLVPDGLEYFSFENFQKRLVAALFKNIPIRGAL